MEEMIRKIDQKIEGYIRVLAEDTKRLVRIKSVKGEPTEGAPFGIGPGAVLDEFVKMACESGLYCRNYDVGVVSAAMKEGKPDLGIWLHGDVVPEGEGWHFPPYEGTEYEGCIIGRGTTDNKGQLAAILGVMRIFQKLEVSLGYNPAVFLGSNEETGMKDVSAFLKKNTPPRLSLVPDASFPVGYGGKGGMNISLRSLRPLQGCCFVAGQTDAPGKATAVVGGREYTAFSPPCHGASPDPAGNMITFLSEKLLEEDRLCAQDREILQFLRAVSSDIYGKIFGIHTAHPVLGELTVFSKSVDCREEYCILNLDIRYPLGITFEQIAERISVAAESNGFSVRSAQNRIPPYLLDREGKMVRGLCRIANSVTGEDKAPYTLKGGTYAHLLPNAYAFGMNGCLPPKDFPRGRGGAHGIDESVSLERLKRAMKIYARTLLWLNETEW